MTGQPAAHAIPASPPHAWYSWLTARVPPRRLVLCGVVMFVLYIAMDVIASVAYDGYSYRDHTISELSAVGAPTRAFWLVFSVVYQALYLAYAIGVIAVAGERRTWRIVGWLLLITALTGFLWWVAPMHTREVLADDGGTWQDSMHLVLGGVTSILFFTMIGIGAFAFGWRFRLYSFVTIAAMLVFGILMNIEVPGVAENEPTPWLGIYERIVIEGAMLWQAIFAVALLLATHPRTGTGSWLR